MFYIFLNMCSKDRGAARVCMDESKENADCGHLSCSVLVWDLLRRQGG